MPSEKVSERSTTLMRLLLTTVLQDGTRREYAFLTGVSRGQPVRPGPNAIFVNSHQLLVVLINSKLLLAGLKCAHGESVPCVEVLITSPTDYTRQRNAVASTERNSLSFILH